MFYWILLDFIIIASSFNLFLSQVIPKTHQETMKGKKTKKHKVRNTSQITKLIKISLYSSIFGISIKHFWFEVSNFWCWTMRTLGRCVVFAMCSFFGFVEWTGEKAQDNLREYYRKGVLRTSSSNNFIKLGKHRLAELDKDLSIERFM